MMQKTYTCSMRVSSYQCDMNSRMKPSAILEIMQEAAGEHAELLGIGRSMLLNQDLVWILTRVEVQMARYPHFGETITLETFPMPNRRWFFPRYFIFRDEDGQQIGCAGSLWALLNITERRMSRPDPVLAMMPDNSDLIAPLGLPATVAEIGGSFDTQERTPVYTDLDMNGHVNNTKYIDWCCNALGIDLLSGHELASFALNYNQEIRPGQTIRTELHRSGCDFSFSGFEGDVRHFDVGGVIRPFSDD